MSGGVDSSTAAAWLVEEGWEVIGLTMQLWDHGQSLSTTSRTCCASEDIYDARQVAQRLGIPLYVLNMEEAFRQQVVDGFLTDYRQGRTPNPCIRCNQYLKFQLLLDKARALSASFLATGHYAIHKMSDDGTPQLWRGVDHKKDQSYFLFTVTAPQLSLLRFPIGSLTKEETRRLAEKFGLHVARKRESQDLCFVPDGDYESFFRQHGLPEEAGDIVDTSGRRLGTHHGLSRYTIGQRRGLGIASPHPLYVVALQVEENRLIVGEEGALYRDSLKLAEVNWLGPAGNQHRLAARIRYAAEPQPATFIPGELGLGEVFFDQPQRAITPGQACVFYLGDQMVGGGWIL
ncbi:MAG: tRNA 2-thiouridine(34) synthase MnmA [Magnetococcales bacterium]|nr:tRNA 2-thiouridine(34) synthase MnmA [Magnetococcales bacterium]NGZ28501.1 tRNA 2-thiouridine(34) synthase MnmA [Magnetococcales bacterium]